MERMKNLTQRLLRVGRLGRIVAEHGLINTTDLLVATAGTVVLSAAIGGAAISTLNEAKYGKGQPDASTIAQAINSFYKDTGRWPGQAEYAADTSKPVLLVTAKVGTTDFTTFLPRVAGSGLKTTGVTCAANSLQGFVKKATVGYASSTSSALIGSNFNIKNLNDYLVRKPTGVSGTVNLDKAYPRWKGPYLQEITGDPWQRAWVAYLAPLYCSEAVAAGSASGSLGYAWLLSGGSNRTITTDATDFTLDPKGDDTGIILGKLRTKAAPVLN